MRGADKAILLALPLVGLLAAFWMLVLSPQRDEAAQLGEQIEGLEASVAELELTATVAEAARESFPADYRRVVVLGKAVPSGEDTPSLLVQLESLSARTGVGFRALTLEGGGGSVASSSVPAPAPATESGAAGLPIGASVGPAGLPVMPYSLELGGDFFKIANFIGRLDSLVGLRRDGRPEVFGRLVTIDGFSLAPRETGRGLDASFAVTTFVTPPGEGPTGGATPGGPAPPQTQAASADATPSVPPPASVGASLPSGGGR